jgi:hypothetical protein
VAAAFAHTFWWSVGAILIAFVPTLFLPSHAPGAARVETVTDTDGASEEAGSDQRVAGAMLD